MTSEPAAQSHDLHAWIDVSAGVAGDMLLGALIDAGADLHAVQAAVDAVLPATVRLSATEVTRADLRACKLDVSLLVEDHPHRRWPDIQRLIGQGAVPQAVRTKALAVFQALAAAEARVHGVSPDEVHFHEVGAWDSIADVVGVAAALDLLGVDTVTASRVSVGSGRVRAAHGDMAVPSPATLELARGWDVEAGGQGELATPTGLALVRALADECEPLPALTVVAAGIGAGTKDTPGRANVVRVVLGHRIATLPPPDSLTVLEANIDDLDPRAWPEVLSTLFEAGAADAWLTPIIMKKGRPAHTLSVLSTPHLREHLREVIFSATTTFGVREYSVDRTALRRCWTSVHVGTTAVRIKLSLDDTGRIRHATPEFEDASAAARVLRAPVHRVLAEAGAAAHAAGIRVGAVCPPLDPASGASIPDLQE
jgi:pyridinium-3,5-bisthiocarboxylic acid mononucleotide nickel chelatase